MSERPDYEGRKKKAMDMAMNMVVGSTAPAKNAFKGVVGSTKLVRGADKVKYVGKFKSEVLDWAKRLRGKI